MEYIVLGEDGNEYGPVDADTLKKWVEHGRVFKDTQVRNSLMKKWGEAGSLDFLEEPFSAQEVHEEEEEGVSDKLMGALGLKDEHELTPEKNVNTAFKYKYIPNPGSVGQRIGAFAIDSIVMFAFAVLLFLMMNMSVGTMGLGEFAMDSDKMPSGEVEEIDENAETEENDGTFIDPNAEKKEITEKANSVDDEIEDEEFETEIAEPFVPTEYQMKKLNRSFGTFFFIFVTGVLLYYGIGLGLFAQTCGMWFWGLILVKGYNSECFPARAFAFTLSMFAIGILTPIVVAVNPEGRSLHGYLTGTRIIRVAAKPKA